MTVEPRTPLLVALGESLGLKRLGQSDDVASVIAFLVSDDARSAAAGSATTSSEEQYGPIEPN